MFGRVLYLLIELNGNSSMKRSTHITDVIFRSLGFVQHLYCTCFNN